MSKTNTTIKVLERLINQEEIDYVIKEFGYQDTARKFTVKELLKFWVTASAGSWKSFRDGEEKMKDQVDLVNVDHSTIAKKASQVPYECFKLLFHRLVSKCGRCIKRKVKIPTFAIDSTTITAGLNRMAWAPFRGEKSGIKVHVKFDIHDLLPVEVQDSDALEHDSQMLGMLTKSPTSLYIADRGYASYQELERLHQQKQFFVIRLKDNAVLQEENGIFIEDEENVVEDIYAFIGSGVKRTSTRFRIVRFLDSKGNLIQVVTNLIMPEAKTIADLYKSRWEVENFFRWLKQNLNVTSLFGTSPDAVFGQIYSAFITYFIIQWLYIHSKPSDFGKKMSRSEFFRKLFLRTLPKDWSVSMFCVLNRFCRNDYIIY